MIVMAASILGFRAVGALGVEQLADWQAATRYGLAVMFLFTGGSHFIGVRQDLIRMVPPSLPMPGALVTLTGLLELAGAMGLVLPALQRAAAYCLIALLVAMFPANVHAARADLEVAGRSATPLKYRLPMQLTWIGLLWWSVQ